MGPMPFGNLELSDSYRLAHAPARGVGRVEARALARYEADHIVAVPVLEAHQLTPPLGDRHAGGDGIEAAGAQFRDQPLPLLQHDLAIGADLRAER